jgi:ABC-type transporter Mla subunit MlaD
VAEITIRVSDRALRITGIFLCVTVLVWVFFYFWTSGVFVPKYRLRVYVPEVSGLGVQAQVKIDGVQVGSVEAIKLAGGTASPERRIELVLRLDRRYQDAIRSDSVAMVMTEGLLGNRYVNIHRGFRGSAISPDGEIPSMPTQEWTFKDFITSVGKTADCLQAEKNSAESKTQVPRDTPSKPRR